MELAGRIALRPAGLFSVANHWASPSWHIKRTCLVKRDGQKQADFIGGYMQGIFELCDFASFPSLLAGDSCHFFDQSPTCFQHDFPQPNQNHRNATANSSASHNALYAERSYKRPGSFFHQSVSSLVAQVKFFLSYKRHDLLLGSRFATELFPELRSYRYKHLEAQA